MSRPGKFITGVKRIVSMMSGAHVPAYAASADYHMLIALPPAVMLLVSLVRYFPVTQEDVLRVISETVSEPLLSIIDPIVRSIFSSNETVTVISSVLLLISASGAVRALMRGLNQVYGVKRNQSFLVFLGRAVCYTLVLILALVLSLVLLVYGPAILEHLQGLVKKQSFWDGLISFLESTRYLLLALFLIPVFMLFYDRLPAGKRKYRQQFPGALFSALSWILFSWGFSIYVSVSGQFGAYGYLGTVMIVMMWMYYCMMFFLLGGCINVYCASRSEQKQVADDETCIRKKVVEETGQ